MLNITYKMNFSGFPLYSNLFKEVDNENITSEEKQYIMNNIKKIDKQNYEYIYALIISFFIDTNRENAKTIPFEGKQLKTGVKFNLEDFPNKLQKILYTFIHKNLSSEDSHNKNNKKKIVNKKNDQSK